VKSRLAPIALLAAALLPGCAVARRMVPTDTSGMAHPKKWASEAVAEQCWRTKETIVGAPAALREHVRQCWRNLTVDPLSGKTVR
jgi:hypothetical protein